MDALADVLEAVERRRKTLEVHAAADAVAAELETQFATRNVEVVRRSPPANGDRGFVIVRGGDGEFRGALGIDHFRAILSPEIHPPWVLGDVDADLADVLDFLDGTVFASYDRRQMLATAREIEERAWRVGDGTLYTGFQDSAALDAQTAVYDRLARRGTLEVRVFVADERGADLHPAVTVVTDPADEIGRFWFVVFDGAGSDLNECGLLAEERESDRYYGFWTYDPETVDEIVGYLRTEYDVE